MGVSSIELIGGECLQCGILSRGGGGAFVLYSVVEGNEGIFLTFRLSEVYT